jgi:hypothetical protein
MFVHIFSYTYQIDTAVPRELKERCTVSRATCDLSYISNTNVSLPCNADIVLDVDMFMAGDGGVGGVTIVHVGRVRTRPIIQQYLATTLYRDDAPVVRHALEPGLTSAGVSRSHADVLAWGSVVRLRRGAAVHGSAARGEDGRDPASQRREVVSGHAAAQVEGGGQTNADQCDGKFGAEPV